MPTAGACSAAVCSLKMKFAVALSERDMDDCVPMTSTQATYSDAACGRWPALKKRGMLRANEAGSKPVLWQLGPCAGATDEAGMGFGTHPASLPELRAFTQAFGRVLQLLCGPQETAPCPYCA